MSDPIADLTEALQSGRSLKPVFQTILAQFLDEKSILGPAHLQVAIDEVQRYKASGGKLTAEQSADFMEAQALVLGRGDLEKGLADIGVQAMKRGLGMNESMAVVNAACQELRDAGRITEVLHRLAVARFARLSLGIDDSGKPLPGSPLLRTPAPKSKGCALLFALVVLLGALGSAFAVRAIG
ncbi:MAG TPA: hypothetical protein VEN81_16825 [Planctomycetota bacterium]|nr:hypothetical protein [Planctomycetota bacterium]